MTATLDQIGKLLTEENLKSTKVSDHTLRLGFNTSNFTNRKGEKSLVILLQVRDGGQYLAAQAPNAFRLSGDHMHAGMDLLLRLQWAWKLVRFEYDHTDGEIRPSAELPLGTMELDAGSLAVFIRTLVYVIESTVPAFEHAIKTGEVLVPGASAASPEPAGLEALSDEHVAVLAELSPAQLARLCEVLVGVDSSGVEAA